MSDKKRFILHNDAIVSDTQDLDEEAEKTPARRTKTAEIPANLVLPSFHPQKEGFRSCNSYGNKCIQKEPKEKYYPRKERETLQGLDESSCFHTLPDSFRPALIAASNEAPPSCFSNSLLLGGSDSVAASTFAEPLENQYFTPTKQISSNGIRGGLHATSTSSLKSSSFPFSTNQDKGDYLEHSFAIKSDLSIQDSFQAILNVSNSLHFLVLRTYLNKKIELCKTETGLITVFSINFTEKDFLDATEAFVSIEFLFLRGDETQYLYYVDAICKQFTSMRNTTIAGKNSPITHGLVSYWNDYKDIYSDGEDDGFDENEKDNPFCEFCGGFNCVPGDKEAMDLINDIFMVDSFHVRIDSLQQLLESCYCPKVLEMYLLRFDKLIDGIITSVILGRTPIELKRYGMCFLLQVLQNEIDGSRILISRENLEKMYIEIKALIFTLTEDKRKMKENMDPEVVVTKNISENLLEYLQKIQPPLTA